MKKLIIAVLAITTIASCTNTKQTTEDVTLSNGNDSLSYAIGLSIAENLSQQEIDINAEALAQGFKNLADSSNTWNTEEANNYIQTEMKRIADAKAEEGKSEGVNWLIENATKPNVQTTASGLQYIILEEGTGLSPTETDKVTVHYTGMLTNGTVFDSSVEKGQPITHPVNGFVKGWTEGLQLIKEGGKIKLFLPENLAYGANPPPGSGIPPFSTLVFDMELISVDKSE